MKYAVILLILIGSTGIAYASNDGDTFHSDVNTTEEHYEIKIIGLKDEYVIGEQYSFYFVISGNGHECARTEVRYPDENGKLNGWGSYPLCDSNLVMHDFETKYVDQQEPFGNIAINNPGTYAVTVTFDRPNKYFPTTATKEFRVAESVDENSDKLSPLKQHRSGVPSDEIQCNDLLVLVTKNNGSPVCVTELTRQKLIDRGWTYNSTKIQETIQRLEHNPHQSLELSSKDAKFIEQLALQHPDVANFVREIEWKSECCKDTFVAETQEYELSITFQRLDKDSHLRVIFDRDTLDVLDVTNDRYIRFTPIPQESLDIAKVEGNYVHLNPTGMCATITLELMSPHDIDQNLSEKEIVFFEIDDNDLEEMPLLRELMLATHHIEPPKNDHESIEVSTRELVEYELFIMNKAIAKYGDSSQDYFSKFDPDLDEKLANSKKQGFANEFHSPILVYEDKAYSFGGTVFWTSDEHEPRMIRVYLQDKIEEDEKFIVLTENDMNSLPKIMDGINKIGTKFEGVVAFKGVPENPDWNDYREWFQQKSLQFESDKQYVMGFVYDNEFYDMGFPIC